MNTTASTAKIDQNKSGSRFSKRFYFGMPLFFYLSLIVPLILMCPFFPEQMWVNFDPFSRIVGVVAWLLIVPRFLQPHERFFSAKLWKFNRTNVLYGIFSGLVLLPLFLGFASLFDLSKLVTRMATPSWPASVALLFFVNSFVTPFCEELIWRGILWDRLAKSRGLIAALLITSTGFGLAHILTDFSFVRIPAIVVFGLGCGLVRMRWGLGAAYATHATCNLLAGAWVFFPTLSQKILMFLGL